MLITERGMFSTAHEVGKWASLRWRHNGHDGVSNHQPHDCLLNRLFRRRSEKTSKLRVTGLCAGNSPGTGEFPAQRPVTREMVPFDDVIMHFENYITVTSHELHIDPWYPYPCPLLNYFEFLYIASPLWLYHIPWMCLCTLHFKFQKENGGVVMINFYPSFISCNETATTGQVVGRLL